MSPKEPAEKAVRDSRRKTRKQYAAEEKIRIVLAGLRGEESLAALCRREGIAESLYYSWSKEFLESRPRLLSDLLYLRCPGRMAGRPGHIPCPWRPNHPQTQGKIERWHQTLKNRVLLENYYLPGVFVATMFVILSCSFLSSKDHFAT